MRENDSKKLPSPGIVSIVGVGASAGGLEALRTFFGAFKTVPPSMSFVVVQHLSPQHRSMLVELIAHSTTLQVKELLHHAKLQPGIVYITPPNKDAILDGSRIILKAPHFKVGPKPSIDIFFKSLAQSAGKQAIAVILSGTGSDGSIGIKDVKAAGGVVFCQTPSSAKYDGMPKAAELTGAVDFNLAPEEMPEQLIKISTHIEGSRLQTFAKNDDYYFQILAILKSAVGVDFQKYKQATIRRRIERRLTATKTTSLKEYCELLEKKESEIPKLYQDLLISVTSFFRDSDLFMGLKKELISQIGKKHLTRNFRVWVIGCATGEEAYSIAILVNECFRSLKKQISLQIFASDVDENALQIARRGIYSESHVRHLPEGLRKRYFNLVSDGYQVNQSIRQSIIFAKHNILADPPFLNMDLVSCRNILIYFDTGLQNRVFQTIHYALERDGLLFLGKSENVPAQPKYFSTQDKQKKVFHKNEIKGQLPQADAKVEKLRDSSLVAKKTVHVGQPAEQVDAVISALAPNSISVGSDLQILHVYGNAGKYLSIPSGNATHFLNRLLPPEVSFELPLLLQRTLKTGTISTGLKRRLSLRNKKIDLQLKVATLPSQEGARFLVSIDETKVDKAAPASQKPESKAGDVATLKQDLIDTRNALRSIIEEQEASGEELQSLNEEMQSANEELQSSNEELETANEELQSSNEELTTLNEEINVKSAELSALNFRLQAIQNAIIYPIVVVDNKLKLVTFNPAARFLLRLGEHDQGHHLMEVSNHLDLRGPIEALQTCIRKGTETKIQFNSNERYFEIQIQIVRGLKNEVDGAVMSFVENTEIVTALEQNKSVRSRLSDILDNTPAMVSMKDPSGVFVYTNKRFAEVLSKTSDEILGCTTEELFGSSIGEEIRERDFEVIKKRTAIQSDELIKIGDKTHWWASSKFPLLDSQNKVQSVCTISLDVTERVSHEQQLELFKKAVSTAGTGIVIFEWKQENWVTSYVSEHLIRFYGLDPIAKPTVEKLLVKLLPHLRLDLIDELTDSVKSGKSIARNINTADEDSRESWIEFRVFPLKFDEESSYVVITISDITQTFKDQKLIATQQDELSKFNRYSAIGEISAGIAHEVNTPLNVISTKTDLLKLMAKSGKMGPDKILQVSGDISQMVKNISSIVLGLKALTGETSEKFEKIDITSLVEDTLKICEFRIQRSGVSLRTRIPTNEIFVKVIPVQISQIIINLVNNSVDAVQDKKDQWIEVEIVEKRDGVHIIVTDSGYGIDAALAEKIMTPFFTTKQDSKGTGIGLSLSRSIARRHGGNLSLDGNHNHTSFVITLPKYSTEAIIDLNEMVENGT